MKDNDEIQEFAAAALVQMSPSLLKSFTSRAVGRQSNCDSRHSAATGGRKFVRLTYFA
jgi:hypothetical protein